MVFAEGRKRRIALLMVLVLLFTPILRVSAEGQTEEIQETELPEETETPENTEPPIETEAPEETEPPIETEAPEETEPPIETEAPEETESPEERETPEETEPPAETETPEETDPPEVSEETQPPEEPTEPEEEQIPEETEALQVTEPTEETLPMEEMVLWARRPVPLTVGQLLDLPAGEELLLLEGTVVFASDRQAVVQDDTGGIRLAIEEGKDLAPGDVLLITGYRTKGGFRVEEFEKTGTGERPVRESTLAESPEALRILVKGAVLGHNSLTQNGVTCQLEAEIPEGIAYGDRVDVWGVILDGEFNADTMVLSESQNPDSDPEFDSDWNFYFGLLHAHTDLSDGLGTVEQAFQYAADVENLDFFAVTDHSNSFDNALLGSAASEGTAISQKWAAGKAAAEAATDETFVAIFGYEMTWPEDLAIGHISTFNTPGWQTRDQDGMNTLKGYLDALAEVPDSVSQFNHPGTAYGDFCNFSQYSPQQDARVHLLEVGSEGSFRAYNAYTTALDAGWHLAPSNNQNNHKGNWGADSDVRTVILARDLTEEDIYSAIRDYRVYATEDKDLKILYHLNGEIMGSTLPETSERRVQIRLEDGSGDPIGQVEVITDGGKVAASTTISESSGSCSLNITASGSYYYLRILRDGKIVAVTAPVWMETYEDLGAESFTTDTPKPAQGTTANLKLTLFNHEHVPFTVERVTFSVGSEILEQIFAPGNVPPVGQLQIPFSYTQAVPGTLTIIALVEGKIAGLSRSYQKSLTLRFQAPRADVKDVEDVREGSLGDVYRIQGYVTAGTANPYNSFDQSIYLQDDTGGIAVMDFGQEGVQLGTPMEVQGILRSVGGNLVLAMTDYEILEETYYRHVPETMFHEEAMDYETYGGQLMQIEGHVVSLTRTADNLGVARFTLRDIHGDLATVMVEDGIGSGAYGTNELASEVKNTRCVRAMGLLHIDEFGTTVLRVRNCDEVAYVPPRKDPSNPGTGDFFAWLLEWLQ